MRYDAKPALLSAWVAMHSGAVWLCARPYSQRITARVDRHSFLAACTPVTTAFFEQMLNEAEARGMTLYWGTAGFSVRMPLEQPLTVMYGYPPDEFQVYTGGWPIDNQGRTEFRRRLREVAPFSLGGQYTLRLHVDEKTQQQAYTALAFMWAEVERMMTEAGKK